ncbi:acyl carrier protein [Pseudomonas sp. rhizo66]|uniref:acyl carrier protein n=1 Tax=Pseudomonas sp. rhizo66 TaxID=3059674 RepID=UPI00288E871B|nr:acyl carrier protein [Pseudomonas sp. rhizo66]MDT3310572.1 acyl carrier protein [Pseudomonas sp. rhizo66]
MEQNIERRVKKLIAENLYRKDEDGNQVEVRNESSFVDDLGADSLQTSLMLMAVEDEFELKISDEEAEKFTTVQKVIDYLVIADELRYADE